MEQEAFRNGHSWQNDTLHPRNSAGTGVRRQRAYRKRERRNDNDPGVPPVQPRYRNKRPHVGRSAPEAR